MPAWSRAPVLALVLAAAVTGPARSAAVDLPRAAPTVSDRIRTGVEIRRPRVRIGLEGHADAVRIGARSGGFRILDGASGAPLFEGRAAGPVLVVPAGEPVADRSEVFRIQVGSFREEHRARDLARRLEAELRAPAAARWEPTRGVWRVRLGEADRREDLAELLGAVREAGWDDAFIAGEPRTRRRDGGLRLVDARWVDLPVATSRVVFVPEADLLLVEDRPYRGLIEVLLDPWGALVVVNELHVEDYLRGVVPEELGPAAWPELEALKAQAVAARTYVLGNLGQFAELGYDICDSPRCQVYGGAASEHPLSDRAVRETRGEILVHGRRPINAMYTSTCGGHTEDVEVVFPDMTAPWLRGVPCLPDEEDLARRRIVLRGRPVAPVPRGPAGGDDAALRERLAAHGIVGRDALEPARLAAPVTALDAMRWATALAAAAGLPAPPPAPDPPTRLGLWRWLWHADDSGAGLVGPRDESAVLVPDDARSLPPDDRRLVASLLARRLVRAQEDGRLHAGDVPPREEVLAWLGRRALELDAIPWREAVLLGRRGDSLRLRERRTVRAWRLARSPSLVAQSAGAWHPVERLELAPGDRVAFVEDRDGRLALLAAFERRGTTDDRYSARYRWTVARDRRELERSLARVAPVGRIRDLKIVSRGVSGRVREVEIAGTDGTARVAGFRIRRALGLWETLFDVELQRDPDGLVRRAIFRGRGWGHGVGLCQVGAYGRALRGDGYRQILHHYYTGVRLVRVGGTR
ncbi:MAG: hypothetical protein Kow0062_26080 [Acidobacteriota bacterium]